MSLEQLGKLGFECKADDLMCEGPTGSDKYSLFGATTAVSVSTEGGHLTAISACILSVTPRQLVDLIASSLGKPKSKTYLAIGGLRIKNFWVSTSGTAVSVTTRGADEVDTDRFACVDYLGPKEAKMLFVKDNDF
jgi:hypothetical protein